MCSAQDAAGETAAAAAVAWRVPVLQFVSLRHGRH